MTNIDDFLNFAKQDRKNSKQELVKRINGYCNVGVATKYDPISNTYGRVIFRCKKYRECETCAGIRQGHITARIDRIFCNYSNIHLAMAGDKEYEAIRRKYGTDNVVRFPIDGGENVVLIHGSGRGSLVERWNLSERLLALITLTPAGKRISGNLGKLEEEEEEEEKPEIVNPVEIKWRNFAAVLSEEEFDGYVKEANELVELPPLKIDEVQAAVTLVQKTLTSLWDRDDVEWNVLYNKKEVIDFDEISWNNIKIKTNKSYKTQRIKFSEFTFPNTQRKRPSYAPL